MLSGDSGICGYVGAATVVLGINPVDHKVGLIISPLRVDRQDASMEMLSNCMLWYC